MFNFFSLHTRYFFCLPRQWFDLFTKTMVWSVYQDKGLISLPRQWFNLFTKIRVGFDMFTKIRVGFDLFTKTMVGFVELRLLIIKHFLLRTMEQCWEETMPPQMWSCWLYLFILYCSNLCMRIISEMFTISDIIQWAWTPMII